MKKNVFMILFVLFSMACFTLVDYQPLERDSVKTELTVDNHSYDVAIATIESQEVFGLEITEGVAISTGGKESQIIIYSNDLKLKNNFSDKDARLIICQHGQQTSQLNERFDLRIRSPVI